MGVALVTLPDGKKTRITFDSQEQLDATVGDIVKQHTPPKSLSERMTHNPVTEGVGETALQMAGGMAGAAAGGARGIYDVATGQGTDKAVEDIESTERALSYEPKTKAGKAVSSAVAAPFTWFAGKADQAGAAVAEASGSPALGAAANVAIQAAPAVVGKAMGEGVSQLRGAAAAREAATRPRVEPTVDPSPAPSAAATAQPAAQPAAPVQSAAQPAPLTATGAPRPAYSTVGSGPIKASKTPPAANEARARDYARTIGLDFDRLGAGTKKALTTIAQDATALDRLPPKAVQRQALLDSQRIPVPASRGMLTRDPAELRREAIVSRTDEGAPLRQIDVGANRAIQGNLEALRGRAAGLKGGLHEPVNEEGVPAATPSVRAPTKLPSQVGESAQNAVREKQKWSQKGYQALYKRARETEPNAKVSTQPLTELLDKNPDIQHLGFLKGWLSKAEKTPGGAKEITLSELQDLRTEATGLAKAGGTDGYHAGKVVKAIDEAMSKIPAGAKAWKAANDAFKAHHREFTDQATVKQLSSQTKAGGNKALPLEETWPKLARGPLENLRQVKRTMLTGGTPKIREMGRRAWRDLRGETINRVLEDARNVVATDETEREILTAAALQKGIKSIPRENLEELIGKRNVRELNDILRTAKITRTQPAARVTESGTVPNALLMAEKVLGLPGIRHLGGHVIVGAAKTIKGLSEKGSAGKTVRRATSSPLDEAAARAPKPKGTSRNAQRYKALEESGPTIGQAINGPQP